MGGAMFSSAVLWLSCMLLCILAVSGDVYFNKKAFLEYDATTKPIISVQDRINVTFKTVQPMGLLLHGSSVGGQASDYITLELVGGKLRYAARLGVDGNKYGDHELYLGEDLADGLPHTVQIERNGKRATIRLDPTTSSSIVRHAKSEFNNLDLDQYIFIGGSSNMQSLQGVQSNTNFMGCIMLASYEYQEKPIVKGKKGIVKKINFLTESNQQGQIKKICPSEAYEPFTFIGIGARFVADTGSASKMVGSFKFRTYNKQGSLLKQKNFEILYRATLVQLEIESQPLSINFENVDKGNWVTVEFEVSSTKLELTVEGQTRQLPGKSLASDFIAKSTVIGKDFVGCMRDIKINKKDHHPSDVSESDHPKVLTKRCGISDFCSPNPCQNEGECTQDGRTFECKCSSASGYEGTICQFAKSPRNCGEIKQDNKKATNGNYTIDADGSGPVKPFKAFCNMTSEIAETEVWSIDQNVNVVKFPLAAGENRLSYVRDITYYPSIAAARALAINSKECKQLIEYGCRKSRLLNNGDYYGRWVSSSGVYKNYWGGADPDSNSCECYPNCLDSSKKCNCDAMRDTWQSDKGFLTETKELPVSQVLFGDVNKDKGKEANFTVGNLICSGEISNNATFVNEDGMLRTKPWTPASHGDMSFFFKTPYPRGVLISNGDLNKEYVQLEISNKTTMLLTFDIGNGAQHIYASVNKGELNDREWHRVAIYRNQKEFSLKVDDVENKVTLDLSKKRGLNVEGDMYLGSDPKALNGFVGCMRGLAINGQVKDLETSATNAVAGSDVKGGCGAACDPNQKNCKLGSECIDDFNVYRCNCTMTPFYGYFCHKDHGAAFDGEDSKMTYTFKEFVGVPGLTLAVGFKSRYCKGEIVRITSKDTDQFFSLGFTNNKLEFKFKSADGDGTIDVSGSFCDNERHTFALSRLNRQVRYRVDNDEWKSQDRTRLDKPFASMHQVIVGSTGDKGFTGCITGVKVGQRFHSEKRVPVEPIEAYLYDSDVEEIKEQKRRIEVEGITAFSEEKCGEEPKDTPPIPTPRIPGPRTPGPQEATSGPREDGDEGNNTAIIVIVVLILILVIVAVLVAIYWYWSRHKGTYHTHEDDENLKSTDPYIDLVPTNKGEETQKKKEWYI